MKQNWKIFALLFAVNLFNYIDRQVLYAVFPLLKTEFSLSDASLGFLASAFMAAYTFYSPIAGYLADKFSRPKLMGISAGIWSAATMFCGFVSSYAQIAAARILTGVGEAGYIAISPGYVSSKFDEARRARIVSYLTAAMPVGAAIGYALGGFLAGEFGWRPVFVLVGAPGLLLGFFVFRLPENKKTETASPVRLSDYLGFLKNKSFVFATLSQAMAAFTIGGISAWMPSYFCRYLNFTVAKAGLVFGGITVIGGMLGTLAGGIIADAIKKKNPNGYFRASSIGFLCSVPFCYAGLSVKNPVAACVFFALAIFFVFFYAGPLIAAVISVVDKTKQSMAVGLCLFFMHILGDAASPSIVGLVSDKYTLKTGLMFCVGALFLGLLFSELAAAAKNTGQDDKNLCLK